VRGLRDIGRLDISSSPPLAHPSLANGLTTAKRPACGRIASLKNARSVGTVPLRLPPRSQSAASASSIARIGLPPYFPTNASPRSR
jgi:hypothetical protein